jgi:hypothetical protein
MSNRTATLYIRITTKDGRNSYCKPVYLSKGRLKPHCAVVGDKPEHHPEDVYYIRVGTDGGKQRFESVGKDPYVALDKLAEEQRRLRDRQIQLLIQPFRPQADAGFQNLGQPLCAMPCCSRCARKRDVTCW